MIAMTKLTIANVTIRQDEEGRYCLNDLHRAAGSEKRHQPSDWMRLQSATDLAAALDAEKPGIPGIQSKQGLGTYVCKELVYAYAMWISAAFHLKVIRAYDEMVSGAVPVAVMPRSFAEALRLAADQAERLEQQRPAVEFALAVRNTVDAVSIGDMARVLGYGQNVFFRMLRADHLLMEGNRPYQMYIDRGYFRVIESLWRDSDGEPHPTFKTLITGKGQVFLQRKYGKEVAFA